MSKLRFSNQFFASSEFFLLLKGIFTNVVFYYLLLKHNFQVGARVIFLKNDFFLKKVAKIGIFKSFKRDFSGITESIFILITVLNSENHALSADTSFGAKFKNSKLRNLIGRKFLNFFYENFSLNTIETPWLSWIQLKTHIPRDLGNLNHPSVCDL